MEEKVTRKAISEDELEQITGGSLKYGWQGTDKGGYVNVVGGKSYKVPDGPSYKKVSAYIRTNCYDMEDSEMISYMLSQGWIK